MIILGVDPGDTTGISLMAFPDRKIMEVGLLELEDVFKYADDLVRRADQVACERYIISMRTVKASRRMDAFYATGWVMGTCRRFQTPFYLQTASDAKTAFPDFMLQDMHLRTPSPHTRDATRHALLAARRSGHSVYVSV